MVHQKTWSFGIRLFKPVVVGHWFVKKRVFVKRVEEKREKRSEEGKQGKAG